MHDEARRILVTGATGRLGVHVCQALTAAGHQVRASDKKFGALPCPLILGELLDEHFVYRVLDGCDSVVHLGNHPNRDAGPSPQRLMAENVAMNANVFSAAVDLGVECIVFASSVQVMLRQASSGMEPPHPVPYLPIDGDAATDPADNPYALSKEFGERMLRLHCQQHPELSATALRFPMLPPAWWVERLTDPRGVPRSALNYGECLAYLTLPDAAELVGRVVARRKRGYHQYFPALSLQIENQPLATLIAERYADVPSRHDAQELPSLIDISRLELDLGFRPKQRLSVRLRE